MLVYQRVSHRILQQTQSVSKHQPPGHLTKQQRCFVFAQLSLGTRMMQIWLESQWSKMVIQIDWVTVSMIQPHSMAHFGEWFLNPILMSTEWRKVTGGQLHIFVSKGHWKMMPARRCSYAVITLRLGDNAPWAEVRGAEDRTWSLFEDVLGFNWHFRTWYSRATFSHSTGSFGSGQCTPISSRIVAVDQ